jgi:hypothetical protein
MFIPNFMTIEVTYLAIPSQVKRSQSEIGYRFVPMTGLTVEDRLLENA